MMIHPKKLQLLLRMQLENSRPRLVIHQRKWHPEITSFGLNIYIYKINVCLRGFKQFGHVGFTNRKFIKVV